MPARLAICSHCILYICYIYFFPVLVLRAGFAFRLPQFLYIAFVLLLVYKLKKIMGKTRFSDQFRKKINR